MNLLLEISKVLFKALTKKLPKVTFSISSWIKDKRFTVVQIYTVLTKVSNFFKTSNKTILFLNNLANFKAFCSFYLLAKTGPFWFKISEKDYVDSGHCTSIEFITINDGVSVIRIESPQFIIIFKNYFFLLLKFILFLEQMCHI